MSMYIDNVCTFFWIGLTEAMNTELCFILFLLSLLLLSKWYFFGLEYMGLTTLLFGYLVWKWGGKRPIFFSRISYLFVLSATSKNSPSASIDQQLASFTSTVLRREPLLWNIIYHKISLLFILNPIDRFRLLSVTSHFDISMYIQRTNISTVLQQAVDRRRHVKRYSGGFWGEWRKIEIFEKENFSCFHTARLNGILRTPHI